MAGNRAVPPILPRGRRRSYHSPRLQPGFGPQNVVPPSLHPGALLKNPPNRFAFAVYAVVAALGLGVGLAASRISAKRRARARKIFR